MSLIEEVMRRQAHERAAMPGGLAANSGAGASAARVARSVVAPAPEAPIQEYRPATVDPEALERNRVLLRVQDVAVSRAYKILRTRVLHRMTANNWYTLGVTGTGAGEGKTITAINLAIALAQDPNAWVFLVDLDLQRPQLGAYLGMSYEYGLTDYLTGQAQLEQVVYDIGIKRLAVVPNSSPVETSSEHLRSAKMTDFINALEGQSPRRYVILDMPPINVSDDVLAFAPRVDSFLLIASQGITARRTLANAKEVLSELNVLGVVLNRSTERNDSPYY
ncbi:MAG: CpsD/CapB family tyrosine-protein kinase [Gammaproteobacteria bacterium]|nr:CpsD/CapB family tyrosine-protein kinase [Gammaproteobacteria bacterium]MDE2260937.1 CpsD/CapB family tyrosine-protein kinase [Gammaproteobacteria bacterium]